MLILFSEFHRYSFLIVKKFIQLSQLLISANNKFIIFIFVIKIIITIIIVGKTTLKLRRKLTVSLVKYETSTVRFRFNKELNGIESR